MSTVSDEKNQDLKSEVYRVPPDGGWGWMVVLSSFLIHVIADGIVYSFGVFFVVFVEHFNSGRGEIAWLGALQPAVTFTVGPIASALTNRYGCRIVTIAGAIISSIGFGISIFAKDLYFLYVSAGFLAAIGLVGVHDSQLLQGFFGNNMFAHALAYGNHILHTCDNAASLAFTTIFMNGLGFGLLYLPSIVCVAQYFEKRRSFATGLAVCGSGVGTFVMAPVTEKLLQIYGWRGAMLIISAVVLNVTVCGTVFRSLDNVPLKSNDCDKIHSDAGAEGDTSGINSLHEKEVLLALEGDVSGRGDIHKVIGFTDKTPCEGVNCGDAMDDDANSPSELKWMCDSQLGIGSIASRRHLLAQGLSSVARSDGALHQQQPVGQRRPHLHSEHAHCVPLSSTVHRLNPVARTDVFYTASLQNIPMFRSHRDLYITSIISVSEPCFNKVKDQSDKAYKCCGVTIHKEFIEAFHQMTDFSLLKNPVFLIFAISNFFTSIGFNMPFIFLPDRANLAGISEDRSAWLLSAIGISNMVGRVAFGFVADMKCVNRLMLYNTALTICGLATALSPLAGDSFRLLVLYAVIFGLFIGVYVSLTSPVLVDLLGIHLLTNSFGLLLLFQGAATFIGPPLAGWMCDWTGSYDISFNVMGSMIAMSGVMLFLLPLVQKWHQRNTPIDELHHIIDMGLSIATDCDRHGGEMCGGIALPPSRKISL